MSVQKVAAILRKAGFTASKSSPTRIRGWHTSTEGFRVRKTYLGTGFARVEFVARDYRHNAEEQESYLCRYEEAIRESGFKVTRINHTLEIAQGIVAGTDETRSGSVERSEIEPGPKDAPESSSQVVE